MSRGADAPEVDGRTARRDRNREAVLDAVLALFREDNLQPRPEEVAMRSEVSLRSVYRYYSDPTELLRAAMARHLEIVLPMLTIPDTGRGPLGQRIDRFVESRMKLYEMVAPTARAARMASVHSPLIRDQYERTRQMLREQAERHFRPELAPLSAKHRRAVSSAIDALMQLDGIDYYRVHRAFSVSETSDLLRVACARLLGS